MATAAIVYNPGTGASVIAVPYAASVVLDMSRATKPVFEIGTLTGNINIDFTNGVNGQEATVITTQNGVGSKIITWNSTRCGGSADLPLPSASTTADKRDVFGIKVVTAATKPYFVVASNRGFVA